MIAEFVIQLAGKLWGGRRRRGQYTRSKTREKKRIRTTDFANAAAFASPSSPRAREEGELRRFVVFAVASEP